MAWTTTGSLKGPQGLQGLTGRGILTATIDSSAASATYRHLLVTYTDAPGVPVDLGVVVGLDGVNGVNGATGATGRGVASAVINASTGRLQLTFSDATTQDLGVVVGTNGHDGAGISIAGSVATYGALPTGLTSTDVGKGYLVQADGDLYIWTGSAFPASGSGVEFRGPIGATGAQGSPGAAGVRGTRWYTGHGAPASDGSSTPGSLASDLYLDVDAGTVYTLA